MEISDFIASFSAIISLIALIKSFLSDRKTKKLDLLIKQQQIEQHESQSQENKKADVEVNVVFMTNGKLNLLKFYNKGKATANNVKFTIITDEGIDDIQLCMDSDYLPYPKLLPQQNFDVRYLSYSQKNHQTILIEWDDEFAKGRNKEMIVDM